MALRISVSARGAFGMWTQNRQLPFLPFRRPRPFYRIHRRRESEKEKTLREAALTRSCFPRLRVHARGRTLVFPGCAAAPFSVHILVNSGLRVPLLLLLLGAGGASRLLACQYCEMAADPSQQVVFPAPDSSPSLPTGLPRGCRAAGLPNGTHRRRPRRNPARRPARPPTPRREVGRAAVPVHVTPGRSAVSRPAGHRQTLG